MVDSADLAATFDLRFRELSLDATVALPQATLKPDAVAPSQAPDLPRITLDFAMREDVALAPAHGDLQIVSTLGEGAMGRVHLARQRSLRRDVAVKTLKPGAPDHARAALLVEAAVTGALEHPGIVPVHALGVDGQGSPVLVMKRIEGVAWAELVHDDAHPAWRDLDLHGDRLEAHLEILEKVCNAVEFAHSQGVIHCDIKPENVMVGRFGAVYLVDWGISVRRGTARGALAGSPGYMPPELVTGEAVDERTDVYLLGATLHEILTRSMRHDGSTLHEVLLSAFLSEPRAYGDDVPAELAELCNLATRRDGSARPARAVELRRALQDYRTHRSSVALAGAASARLDELEALLAGDVFDVPRAYRLATECRFGLAQAIAGWSGNVAAATALERCLEASVEIEIRQRNASGARALLSELAEPPPALEARIAELERAAEAQRERDARLQRIEHDLDVGVGRSTRMWAMIALAVGGSTISAYALHRGAAHLRVSQLVLFALLMLTGVLVVTAAFRKQLLSNAFNRRVVGAVTVLVGGLVVSRSAAYLMGLTVIQTMVQDLVMMTAGATLAAITLSRALFWAAGAYAVGLAVAAAVPSWAPLAFSTTTIGAILLTALAWRS